MISAASSGAGAAQATAEKDTCPAVRPSMLEDKQAKLISLQQACVSLHRDFQLMRSSSSAKLRLKKLRKLHERADALRGSLTVLEMEEREPIAPLPRQPDEKDPVIIAVRRATIEVSETSRLRAGELRRLLGRVENLDDEIQFLEIEWATPARRTR